jgi:hypothetical protein
VYGQIRTSPSRDSEKPFKPDPCVHRTREEQKPHRDREQQHTSTASAYAVKENGIETQLSFLNLRHEHRYIDAPIAFHRSNSILQKAAKHH